MNSESSLERLQEIRGNVFEYVLEADPIRATQMGIHDYDGSLPAGSRSSYREKIEKFEQWYSDLSRIDPDDLPEEERISLQVGKYLLGLWLFQLDDLRLWESNPNQPQTVGSSLMPLLQRKFSPLEERLKSAISRIEQIPSFLENAESLVEDPVKLWLEVSLESLEKLPDLLEVVAAEAEKSDLGEENLDRLSKAITRAHSAFDEYGSWLDREVKNAKEEFAIGPERFEEYLTRQKLNIDISECLEMGKDHLSKSRKSMENYARMIDGVSSVQGAVNKIKGNTPKDFSKALCWYRKSICASRDFVERKNLASIPENENITVAQTPSYLRNLIPFAAYVPPAKYDEENEGIYLVTPPENEEGLSRFAFWFIRNTTVHEAYPGHHLQMSASNQVDDPFFLLASSPETVEGWAHYSEEMMKSYGFGDTPEARVVHMRDRRWRAARVIADVKLGTGEFSYREAVRFMADTSSMAMSSAEAEVKRYTQFPTYQLSYLLGMDRIKQFKKHVKNELGGDYNDRFFHDFLLYGGSIPLEFHRERFGRTDRS